MPYTPKVVKFTLESLGCPEFWYETMDPEAREFGDLIDLTDGMDGASTKEALAKLNSLFSEIVSWNLTAKLSADSEVLRIPSEDVTSIRRLPNAAVTLITQQLAGGQQNPLPQNRSERRSRRS